MEKDPRENDRKYVEKSLAEIRAVLDRMKKSPTLAKYPRLKRQLIAIQVEAISEIKRLAKKSQKIPK